MQELQAQLKKCKHGSPVLRRQAVFGVFQLLRRLSPTSQDAATGAVAACLSQHATPVRRVC
jgi:hypothetical protein